MKTATPAKLRDGSWGVRVQGEDVKQGEKVRVTTRDGKTWTASVTRVVWKGDGVCLCASEEETRPRRRGPPACEECGEIIREEGQRCWETGGTCFRERDYR